MKKGIAKLKKNLHQMLDLLEHNDLIKLLVISEETTIFIRSLIAENLTSESEYIEYEETIIKNSEISIKEKNDGIISIQMPVILPFKKLKNIKIDGLGDSFTVININEDAIRLNKYLKKLNLKRVYYKINAILYPLEIALQKYFDNKILDIDNYSKATFIFTNNYKSIPNQMFPDPDNIEYKQIIDVVCRYLSLGNDNNITIVIRNKLSEKTYTELLIYPNGYININPNCTDNFGTEKNK